MTLFSNSFIQDKSIKGFSYLRCIYYPNQEVILLELKTLFVKNFRNIKEMSLDFTPFTILVGENNVGKTNILMAIYKILRMDESPHRIHFTEEDFYLDESTNERSDKITIELTFNNLNENDESAFLWHGIDIAKNELSIRLEAKWEEENIRLYESPYHWAYDNGTWITDGSTNIIRDDT